MVEKYRNDNLSEWYTAEQACKDTGSPVPENVLDNILDYQLNGIKAAAVAGEYEAELEIYRTHKAFNEIVNKLHDLGYVVYAPYQGLSNHWADYNVCWGKRAKEVIPFLLYDMRDDLLAFREDLEEHEWASLVLWQEFVSSGAAVRIPERYICEDGTVSQAAKDVANLILEGSGLRVVGFTPVKQKDQYDPNFIAKVEEDEA